MKPVIQEMSGIPICELTPAHGTDPDQISIFARRTNSWEVTKKGFMSNSKDAKTVPGVGDDAFYVPGIIGFVARKSDMYVEVMPPVFRAPVDEKILRSLAERAVSRL